MADQPEDLYESGAGQKPMPKESDDKQDEGGKTFLVPSEICPGMKPGEEMVVKIEEVHDEQYSISYAPKKKKEGDEKDGSEEMASAPNPSPEGGGETASLYS